jgi:hypothetical protein
LVGEVDENATDPAFSWSDAAATPIRTMPRLAPLVAALLLHAAGPVATVAPAITGTLQQGKQLTVSTGTWTGSGIVAYAYQWYRCDAAGSHCSSIHGATRTTYTEVARDVGASLSAAVSATDATGTTRMFAPLAGLIAAKTATVVATSQPAVAGSPIVGQAVSVSSRWPSPRFAWQRCNANERLCVPIAGATSATYTVTADDVGFVLVAAVGASGSTVLSLPTAVVAAAQGPAPAGRPSVAGTLQQGQKLTARPGTWLASGPIAYAYQWYRCDETAAHCHSIHGATRNSYTLVAKDVGETLGLTVRATDSTGTAPAYASVAGLVAAPAALAATRQPSLTADGKTLVVKPGAWTGKPGALTYTWLRCNQNGRACTDVTGAAGSRYELTADDRGHEIVAAVHAAAGTTVLTAASLPIS